MQAREKFDPNREFLVNKPFRWSGKSFTHNQVFPKEVCNLRRLRQLYETRWLTMGATNPVDLLPLKPAMPDFARLSASGILMWLANNGHTDADQLTETTPLPELVKIARAHWSKINNVPLEVKSDEPDGSLEKPAELKVEEPPIKLKDEPAEKPAPAKKAKVNGKPNPKRNRKHRGQRIQGPAGYGNSPKRNSLRRR